MGIFASLIRPVLMAAVLVGGSAVSHAQIYSYVDENGARVLTNIPPQTKVLNLKISGSPPAQSISRDNPSKTSEANAKQDLSHPVSQPTVKALQSQAFKGGADPQPAGPNVLDKDGSASEYDSIIDRYSEEYGVDPGLIRSMIATESGFNARAVSNKGAQGLMQLMPATARRLGVRNPYDPEENIAGGVKHMRFLLDMFSGSPNALQLSLAAYNAGENLVQRLGRVPAIRETNEYVSSIIQRYGRTETSIKSGEPIQPPSRIYSYIDKGVVVLTNIPPVGR